jgi:pSer/pThr/pTyr-binding forkhead associated (FHA) protein
MADVICPFCGNLGPESAPLCPACGGPLLTGGTLLLEFPGGRVTVPPGDSIVLGRDPAISDCARVFQRFENVSRLHATLRVEPGGAAWVRDEGSTNGTFVNGVPAVTGEAISLHDGDLLRLAADVAARVRLREDPGDDADG